MGKLFGMGKPDKPEPYKPSQSQIEAEKKGLERQRGQESELKEREAMRKKMMYGGRSSLLRGSALGVQGEGEGLKETLG